MVTHSWKYKAIVAHVVDGDTLDLNVDLGFGVSKFDRFRLFGINAPETYGVKHESAEYADGMKAKKWLIDKIEGANVTVETFKDKQGKYGRYLCVVYLGEENINEMLVKEGLAVVQEY